jgi:electron transfer flavoprotein alpha subunit
MAKSIVWIEHAAGSARRASLECIGAARGLGAEVVAVLFEEGSATSAKDAAAGLGAAGASKVVIFKGSAYSADAVAKAVSELVQAEAATSFLAAATSSGKDLAPRVGARLDCVAFTDCTSLLVENGTFVVHRPWLAGKCLAVLECAAPVLVATTRLNVFAVCSEAAAGEISEQTIAEGRAVVTAVEAKAAGKLDVKEAPIVVSGGRGLGGPEHFSIIEDLAAAFGDAAVGASRAVVDAGWRPHSEQVGQTGKTVSPQIYFAVAISGAIQHLAGMRTSKVIVAINKDPDAPIFKVADYGIVGDAFEVLPALAEQVRSVRASS